MDKYYTISGSEDYVDEDGFPRIEDADAKKVYAKCILAKKPRSITTNSNLGVDKMGYKFYIAINEARTAYDPTDPNQPKANFIQTVCKNKNKFLEVNQYVFAKYVNFLKSPNKRWISEINRDIK